jgi:predicted tellurium resistance membrane protein TerC
MQFREKKLTIQLLTAVILIVVGSGLLIAGFSVPPTGVIDSSVLVAFGEILTFVGALFGIDYHYKSKSK